MQGPLSSRRQHCSWVSFDHDPFPVSRPSRCVLCGEKPSVLCGLLAQVWWVFSDCLLPGKHREGWERGIAAGDCGFSSAAVAPLLLLEEAGPSSCHHWQPTADRDGTAVCSLQRGLSFPTCVPWAPGPIYFRPLENWDAFSWLSVVSKYAYKKWLQKLNDFLNNQIIDVYEY